MPRTVSVSWAPDWVSTLKRLPIARWWSVANCLLTIAPEPELRERAGAGAGRPGEVVEAGDRGGVDAVDLLGLAVRADLALPDAAGGDSGRCA